jgi:hypothetical protein
MHGCNSETEEQLRLVLLTSESVTYAVTVSELDPGREVSHGPRLNLIGEAPLIENNGSLQQEAVGGEYSFLVELQHRRELRGVYDQPIPVPSNITDRAHRNRRKTYTPDHRAINAVDVTVYCINAVTEHVRALLCHRAISLH